MTDLLSDVDTPSDGEYISRVRGGDLAAYGELFARHRDAAQRLARQLVRGPDADDLVSEAFAKVLHVLQTGGGPDVAFRAYLLTAVRRLHVDRVRSGQRLQTTDDLTPFDPGVPFTDTAVAGFESGAAAKAFASLPERWQLVLWHLEVEGQKPADIAPLLGMSANSVSALAYRAREGLRQAFLTMHLSDITEADCRWTNEHLGAYVRNGLAKRDSAKVRTHLDGCRRCTATYLELTEVNSNLSAIIAPLLLGAAATGYLASSGGVGVAGVLGTAFGRVRDVVTANTGMATAGALAVGVAAAAVVGVTLTIGNKPADQVVGADRPVGTVSIAPAVPGSSSPASPSAGGSSSVSSSVSPSASVSGSIATSPSASGSPAALLPGASPSAGGTSSAAVPPSAQPTDQTTGQPSPSDSPSPTPSDSPSPSPSGAPSPSPGPPSPSPSASPIPTPSAPGPVSASVGVTATYGDTGVTLQVGGSSGPPPHFDVQLSSSTGQISFARGGDCTVDIINTPTQASCDTAPTFISSGSAFARSGAVASTDAPYTAFLPFDLSRVTSHTTVSIAVSTPDPGYDTPSVTLTGARLPDYDPAASPSPSPSASPSPSPSPLPSPSGSPTPEAHPSLSLPATVHEDGHDPTRNTFSFTATIQGLPTDGGAVDLSLSGDGTLTSGGHCLVPSGSAGTTCPVVVTYDGTTPASDTLSVTTSWLYTDPAPVTASTILQPEQSDALQAQAVLTLVKNHGLLTVTALGAADDKPVVVTISPRTNGNALQLDPTELSGCKPWGSETSPLRQVSCPSGTGPWTFGISANDGQLSGTVTVDDNAHGPATADFGDGPGQATTLQVVVARVASSLQRTTLTPSAAPSSQGAGTHRSAGSSQRVSSHPGNDKAPGHRAASRSGKHVAKGRASKKHRPARSHRARHGPSSSHGQGSSVAGVAGQVAAVLSTL